MVKVKMRTTTAWEKKLRRPGDVLTVDKKVAERWERNNIAEIVKGKAKEKDSDDGLESLNVNELKALAEEKGIAPGNMKKDDLIAAIRG